VRTARVRVPAATVAGGRSLGAPADAREVSSPTRTLALLMRSARL